MNDIELDAEVQLELERMTIYQRERLRQALLEYLKNEGKARATSEDLAAVRRGGMARMARMMGDGGAERLAVENWPPRPGSYRIIDPAAPVAVATLASDELATKLGEPEGAAIVGKVYTENLGVEKVVTNILANAHIKHLVLCGTESKHRVGQTLMALHRDGLDEESRVIGSQGPIPLVRNLPESALILFQERVRIHDHIGESGPATIQRIVAKAASTETNGNDEVWRPPVAEEPAAPGGQPSMARPTDPAGFILISIGPRADRLILEHYSNDAELLNVISARTADELCGAALSAGAVSDPSHCAYLGREAAKAELARRHGLAYEQDRPLELANG